MKKAIFTFLVLIFLIPSLYAQRVIVNENFETTGFGTDSMPTNWVKESVDPVYGPGLEWAVRDSGTHYVGTNELLVAQAHNGHRALTIPWTAGNPVADDWVFTDTFTVMPGDSLIFWMLIGSPAGFTAYLDTMQIWVTAGPYAALAIEKLATFKSNDSAGVPLATNVWMNHSLVLSAYAGQQICVAFRYYMNTTADGFWCNIDDVFIGNRSYVGIHHIGSNLPKSFALQQNYPNPFNPTTKIKFDIPKNTTVKIEVFNNLGQVVKVLHDGYTSAGYYETEFNASSFTSGVYFYRITTQDFVQTKKMVLIK
jgi:hypothetical protein